jgi:hypothetical protein
VHANRSFGSFSGYVVICAKWKFDGTHGVCMRLHVDWDVAGDRVGRFKAPTQKILVRVCFLRRQQQLASFLSRARCATAIHTAEILSRTLHHCTTCKPQAGLVNLVIYACDPTIEGVSEVSLIFMKPDSLIFVVRFEFTMRQDPAYVQPPAAF